MHIEFFESLAVSCATPDCLCSHGGLDPRLAIHAQSRRAMIWGAFRFPDAYQGSMRVVYGHHNNAVLDDAGWPHPRVSGSTIGIDTIAHGVLTAIRLPDGRLFQSALHPECVRAPE